MSRIDPARLARVRRRDENWWRDGRPTPQLLLLVAGTLGVIVITLLLLQANGEGISEPPPPVASSAPAVAPPSVSVQTDTGNGTTGEGTVPEGYTTLTRSGISAALPQDWTASSGGGKIVFSGPENSQETVTVAKVASAGDGGLGALGDERERSEMNDYIQVQLQPLTWRTWKAADWEFTYTVTSGVPMHTLTRYVTLDDKLAYKITFTSPDLQWDDGAEMREFFLSTFKVTG